MAFNPRGVRGRLLATTLLAGAASLAAPASVAIIASALPTLASAQDYTSGILTGTVTSDSGAPLAGATVQIVSDQGTTRTTTTDANGAFRVPALTVGGYTANISADGYAPISQRVSVAPGGSSFAFTMNSGAANVAELVITAATQTRDFTSTDTGLTVDVQDLATRVPVGRSINAITQLTPGVIQPDPTINASANRNQALASLAGTSAAESVYYINGLNVTDQRTFLGYADLPFDMIQTMDVKTGGYQAEFGRGTGGVVSIVTRSGSNEFHGGVTATWTPNFMRAERGLAYAPGGTNSAGQQVYNQFVQYDQNTQAVWLSGPVIRDHIFLFGVYEARWRNEWGALSYSTPTATNGTINQYTDNSPRWAVKADFVLNENHRLEATIFSDESSETTQPFQFNKASQSITGKLNRYTTTSGGTNQIYKYTGVFTDWFTLSALYGRVQNTYLDYGPAINVPGIQDYVALGGAYATAGRFAGPFDLEGEDIRDTYRVDADFYFNLWGDHHVRVGYDREDLSSKALSAYSGGALYYAVEDSDCEAAGVAPADTGPEGCVEVITFANNGTFEAEQSAWYVQDSWDITPDLNIQLGVRKDIYDYKNIQGESYISIEDQYAPRLGFNWDPLGMGRDKVYGSFGYYYLPIATNTSIRASSGETYTDEYYAATRDGGGNLVIDANGYPVFGNGGVALIPIAYLSPPDPPPPEAVTEEGLEPMYEREIVIGYEHRFDTGMFTDWTMGVRYINRDLQSTIEDTAIGDAVARRCARLSLTCVNYAGIPSTGGNVGGDDYTPADFSEFYPYVLINPGDGARVYLDLEADPRDSVDYDPQWVEFTAADLGLPDAKRTYQALEFTFERPFDGVWGLQGSYTLAKSEGNYEGALKSDITQTDTSITQDFDHAANMIGSDGLLPNHRAHTFKLFGNYAPMERLNVGVNLTVQSPRKYGCIGYTPTTVDPLAPNHYTPSQWFCPIGPGNSVIATPRGSQGETDWTTQVDVGLAYTLLEMDDRGDVTASVDIFNVFDSDNVTRVVEQGAIRPGGARAAYWGMPRSYQSARSARFTLRWAF